MPDLVNVKGLADLNALLETLPLKMQTNIVRGAMRAGATIVKDEAKQGIHNISGALAKDLTVTTKIDRSNSKVIAKVKSKKLGYIARFVEYGTRPHEIKPKTAKSLFIAGLFSELVKHPGAKPRPFLRPALDSRLGEAINAISEYVKKRLTKEGLDTADILVEGDE